VEERLEKEENIFEVKKAVEKVYLLK